ncbi:MAG: hypothetical protein EBZ36_06575 [Acidobacteria bacterium]|nr:hypothetical protein [Acidobacteriota bacterium]
MRQIHNRLFGESGIWFLMAGLLLSASCTMVLAQQPDGRGRAGNAIELDGRKNKEIPLDGPLSRNDPRAKLNRSIENIRVMPLPAHATSGAASVEPLAAAEAGYDITSAQEKYETVVRTGTSNDQLNLTTSEPRLRPGMIGSSVEPSEDDIPGKQVGEADKASLVIDRDDRQLLSPTNFFPRSAVTKLIMTMKNGNQYACSGSMISPRHVLTAAHCIHSIEDGGWAADVEVIPGLDGWYKPFGSAYAIRMRTYQGWTIHQDSDFDIALLTLDRHIGFATGWFGYGYFPSVTGKIGRIMGYPGDLSNGLQIYFDYDLIVNTTNYLVYHRIDTAVGQGGSGIYLFDSGGDRYVFGVHAFGEDDTKNGGTLITSSRFDDLKNWIERW